jgi:glutathione S-transferase
MLKLFYAPGSCALASHIALEEAGADYTGHRVDTMGGEQRKPNLTFIAQSFPKAKLAPFDDVWAYAQLQSFNAYLCATVHVAHAHRMRGYRWADEQSSFDDMKRKVPETVGACFELIEREMLKSPWVMGEAYSICDPYLFTLAEWMESDGLDPKRFPKVHDHRTRMYDRPAVKRALAQEGRG